MNIKNIILVTFTLALFSCGGGIVGGSYQENLKKLDELYGYCDNPQRNMNKSSRAYKTCKDKERAAGPDGLTDDDFKLPFQDILDGRYNSQNNQVYVSAVNPYLWNGALGVLSGYPLKNVDSQGGYMETEFSYDQTSLGKSRCAIKIQITSNELISTGVSTNIICQNEKDSIWLDDGGDYSQEAKQITLKILEQARILQQQDKSSS